LGTTDILRRAEISVTTVSVTGDLKVIGAHQIPVIADALFEETDFSNIDVLILPGGMPGASNLNAHDGLKKLLLKQVAEGKQVAAICAAPLVPGGLELLKGKMPRAIRDLKPNCWGPTSPGKR